MRLSTLVDAARQRAGALGWEAHDPGIDTDPEITRIAFDSREVGPDDLFVCLRGRRSDGALHIPDATNRGAVALLVEAPAGERSPVAVDLPTVVVRDSRHAMALLACVISRDPSRELFAVAITGTNGKTTTAHLVSGVLSHAGVACGAIGTLTGVRTTPEAPHLQRQLRTMLDDGLAAVALEVSSHALVQHRVTGSRFSVGVFTNLSPDHLDFHGDLESYFAAKAVLFRSGLVGAAVVNGDDPWGARLAAEVAAGQDLPLTVISDSSISDLRTDIAGSTFTWRGHPIRLAIPGRFNVSNAVAAAEAARFAGLSDGAIAAGLRAVGQVPGRFEVVAAGDVRTGHPTVVVDYAHTPDGIEKVLAAVREISPDARILIVFGCGGDRDRDKRPLMGRAARGADQVIVTSDNPRSEDPGTIMSAILPGLVGHRSVEVIADRRAAIAAAIASAGANDVVVVAGKGHETTQTIGDREVGFDDREVVRSILAVVGS